MVLRRDERPELAPIRCGNRAEHCIIGSVEDDDAGRTAVVDRQRARVRDVAVDMVAIAKEGLKSRNRLSGGLVDERGHLAELEEIADSGITPAERLLELYHGRWQGDVTRMYAEFAY